MPPILDLHNLRVHFIINGNRLKAVDGVDIKIMEREIVGLVGESGCGKTMTGLSIMRLVPPPGRIVQGEILLYNQDLMELDEEQMRNIRGSKISMIFQDPFSSLNPVLSIEEQIVETIKIHHKVTTTEARQRAIETLSLVKMPDPSVQMRYFPHQFSGGMRQRIMIAMALSCMPKLLIADEPTTALDPTIQAQILALLVEIKENLKMSILLITHDFGVVSGICNKVAVMYAGKIVEWAETKELFTNPLHPYTVGLMKSFPNFSSKEKRLYSIKGQPPDLSEIISGCAFAPRCEKAWSYCTERLPSIKAIKPNHLVRCFEIQGDSGNGG